VLIGVLESLEGLGGLTGFEVGPGLKQKRKQIPRGNDRKKGKSKSKGSGKGKDKDKDKGKGKGKGKGKANTGSTAYHKNKSVMLRSR
jgi:hypothetical protein